MLRQRKRKTLSIQQIRRWIGAIAFDVPRYVFHVMLRRQWALYRNRADKALLSHNPPGVRLQTRLTSSLYLCDQIPWFGRHLMRQALRQWPIELADEVQFSDKPVITVLLPHRGTERVDLLCATIRSFAANGDVPMECIVIEQSVVPELTALPGNTRLIHAPCRPGEPRWHKTLAYNVGAKHARGSILICHDGDVLVPRNYVAEIQKHFEDLEVDVVFPQRLLFYLTDRASHELMNRSSSTPLRFWDFDDIRQNWVGGTLAIRKSAFEAIGGFDEEFVGWTGEDTEFHDRCQALNGWFLGYLPFLHLWHAPQPSKTGVEREAQVQFTQMKLKESRDERIQKQRAARAKDIVR